MTYLQKVEKSTNMVEISKIILSDIWADYSVLFANNYRPFVRSNETQDNWIKSVNDTYFNNIKSDRINLFNSIPERFKLTKMYKELSKKLA
jgi:hypothetical protein